MSDEMVYRVTRAICDNMNYSEAWPPCEYTGGVCARCDAILEGLGRGAIAAMREPTEAMLDAGDSTMPQIRADQDITTGYDALKEAWPAMIDAAVSPAERGVHTNRARQMTLIERLRIHMKDYSAAVEAADEIERLQNRTQLQAEMIERRDTALRRIASLDEKNVPKYAQQIVREFYASVGISRPVGTPAVTK